MNSCNDEREVPCVSLPAYSCGKLFFLKQESMPFEGRILELPAFHQIMGFLLFSPVRKCRRSSSYEI